MLADQSEQPDDGIEVIPFTLILHNLNTNVIDPTHSFIPTKSALAYTGSNVLDEVIGNKDRVCTGETPFDNYFAPKHNEEHISFTTESVAWLKEELDINTPFPKTTVSNISMSGISQINQGQWTTYSVPNMGGNVTYNWYFDVGGLKGQKLRGWKILSNYGNEILVEAGYKGVSVVCEITGFCANSKQGKYVDVIDEGDPCGPILLLSSNPMQKNSSSNKISVIDAEPCDPYPPFPELLKTTGKKENNSSKLKKSILPKNYTLEIYSVFNKKVFSQTQKTNEFNIPVLKKGVYIVKFSASNKTITKRLFIE